MHERILYELSPYETLDEGANMHEIYPNASFSYEGILKMQILNDVELIMLGNRYKEMFQVDETSLGWLTKAQEQDNQRRA